MAHEAMPDSSCPALGDGPAAPCAAACCREESREGGWEEGEGEGKENAAALSF